MAGLLLFVSGALQFVVSARLALPVTETFVVPLALPPVSIVSALARAAAFCAMAVGIGGELGLTAKSRPGMVAVIVWGLRDLVFLALDALPGTLLGGAPQLGEIPIAVEILVALAGVTAAVVVVRSRVLVGWVRWTLMPLAVIEAALVVLFDLPGIGQPIALAIATLPTEFIEPVLTLAIAGALLTWGRLEAVKHRAKVIHDAW